MRKEAEPPKLLCPMPGPDPSEDDPLEASIRSLPVTFEAVVGGEEDAMAPPDRLDMEDHFEMARRGHPKAIRVFRHLARTYPEIASLKNLLYVAYTSAGRKREAEELLEETHRRHPDYLFARVNLAIARIKDDRPGEARGYLGDSLRIPALPAWRESYHNSEVRSWYVAVALLHLAEDRLGTARAIHRALAAVLGENDPGVLQIGREIGGRNLRSFQQRMAADKARAVRVAVPPRPRPLHPVFLPPSFHHREIEELYRHGMDEAPGELSTLLALPRETLVRDLEAVLGDFHERGRLFLEGKLPSDEEATAFPYHAMLLLGELGADEALPRILDALGEEEPLLEFFFGDWLFQIHRPIRQLVGARLDEAEAWVLAPGRPADSRGLVARGVAALACDDPARRGEALAWFRRVLSALLEAVPGDGILDTHFVSCLVGEAMSLRAVELRPLVAGLYAKDRVALAFVGDLDDFDQAMTEPRDRPDFRPLKPLAEFYRGSFREEDGGSEEEFEEEEEDSFDDDEDAFDPPSSSFDRLEGRPATSPFRPSAARPSAARPGAALPKVGRNDPCPCGSGKKHKKCCG